jgi:Fe2+ or Zn2+ uptake regulation protein
MTESKIYITDKNKAHAICPQCGAVTTIDGA